TRFPLGCYGYGIVVTPSRLLLSSNGCTAILGADPSSGSTRTVSAGGNLCDPLGIAVAENGDIFVADASRSCQGNKEEAGAVIRVSPVGGAQSIVSQRSNLLLPAAISAVPTLRVS